MFNGYYDERTGTWTTNPKYQEILRLDKMLTEANIPHTLRAKMDGWQVCYPTDVDSTDCVMDAIEYWGSYGSGADLLEIMGLLTPAEEACDSVLGQLTAQDVFERIRKHWIGEWEDCIKCLSKTASDDTTSESIPGMFDDIYIYVPDAREIIRIAEGDGTNLLEEDIQNGYADYIYYEQHELSVDLPEVDGGQVMLTKPFHDCFSSMEECIPRVLDMAYGVDSIPYVVLK